MGFLLQTSDFIPTFAGSFLESASRMLPCYVATKIPRDHLVRSTRRVSNRPVLDLGDGPWPRRSPSPVELRPVFRVETELPLRSPRHAFTTTKSAFHRRLSHVGLVVDDANARSLYLSRQASHTGRRKETGNAAPPARSAPAKVPWGRVLPPGSLLRTAARTPWSPRHTSRNHLAACRVRSRRRCRNRRRRRCC